MRYTINLDCKTKVGRDGTFPILLRVSLNGEHKYLNTGRKIKDSHYDRKNKSIKSGIKGLGDTIAFIDRQKVRLVEIINGFEKRGEIATFAKVKELYEKETGRVKSHCFFEYVGERIAWEREHTEITKGTLDNYQRNLVKLKSYRGKLSIHDIDAKFITEYFNYIIETLGQAQNTLFNAKVFLRKYVKKLFDEGKISRYPFSEIIVGSSNEVDPVYLELEELRQLHNLYDSKQLLSVVKKAKSKHARDFKIGKKLQDVLKYFLVACYSGLRHSDIKTLRREHIVGDNIVKRMVKGRKGVHKIARIPIQESLWSLIESNQSNEFIFESPVMENSQTNKYLKAIMNIAHLNKHVTFHSARHSFAIISLRLGMSFEVISNVLGHSELQTTKRYARIVDSHKKLEMAKWNGFRKNRDNKIEIFCRNCNHLILTIDRNVIKLKEMECVCPDCQTSQVHSLGANQFGVGNELARIG